MQSESGKTKLSELEQMKADVEQQKLELAEKEEEVKRLVKKQKMMEQAAKLREQAQELERQAAELVQQATAKTTVSTNTERGVAGSASLQPASVAAPVVTPVAAHVAAKPNVSTWPKLTQALLRHADKVQPDGPRNSDDGGPAWLGGTFFEIKCQMTKDDPDCAGEHCHDPAHNREIYNREKNPEGNVMRFHDGSQMQRRPTPTVTDERLRELQKTAEQEKARHAKKQRGKKRDAQDVINSSKQSAANGGAAVSAAGGAAVSASGGASNNKPVMTVSRAKGGRGGFGPRGVVVAVVDANYMKLNHWPVATPNKLRKLLMRCSV